MVALAVGDTARAEIAFLVEELTPAVELGKASANHPWDGAVRAQIGLVVARLKQSPVLRSAVAEGRLKIVGAWYNLETGRVEITDQ